MSLIGVLLVIALIGVVVWLILQIPMPPVFRNLILGVAIVVIILWLLSKIGGVDLPAF